MDETSPADPTQAVQDAPAAIGVDSAEDVTEQDLNAYLPGRERPYGIALCLSGGGFRAALLHLGAMRRLNELGVLSKVETVSSVSGGSIIAAFFAKNLSPWPAPGSIVPGEKWDRLTQPFRDFAQKNLRTLPLLRRLWFFQPSGAIEALKDRYRKQLTNQTLRQLPDRPRFIFCACELSYGVNWIFSKELVGDYQIGYMRPAPDWPVALAVAASSCFPPAFEPLPVPDEFKSASLINSKAKKNRDPKYARNLASLLLNDAGVYDNLGLEPVWKTHKTVLVSDGGATFDPEWDKGIIWRTSRAMKILGNQATALRKRWLMAGFQAQDSNVGNRNPYALDGTYWGIGTPAGAYGERGKTPPPGYSAQAVTQFIAQIRTDMDAFTSAEAQILENHGYLLADAAVKRYQAHLIEHTAAPLAVPYPNWFGGADLDSRVAKALGESSKVQVLGRW